MGVVSGFVTGSATRTSCIPVVQSSHNHISKKKKDPYQMIYKGSIDAEKHDDDDGMCS